MDEQQRPSRGASLTNRVLAFQRDGRGAAAIRRELSLYVYRYPLRKYPTLEEDAAGDFFLFCEPKLERLVDRFRDCGKPFEHYLNSVLCWQLKSFLARRRRVESGWQVGLHSPIWCDGHPGYSMQVETRNPSTRRHARTAGCRHTNAATANTGPATVHAKRLLFALLKSGHDTDPETLESAVADIGCSRQWLDEVIARLRSLRSGAYRRLEQLRARRNQAFAALTVAESTAITESDAVRREQALGRAQRLRKTVRTAQEEMARVRLAPTNREIGTVLGIPKGTVDTGLFWLKRQYAASYAAASATAPRQQQPA